MASSPTYSTLQSVISSIDKSIQPSTPSIISAGSLPSLNYTSSSCDSITQDQKDNLTKNAGSTLDKVRNFQKTVKDQAQLRNAANCVDYLTFVQYILTQNCWDIQYLLVGPSPYQTNINTNKSWILGGIPLNNLIKDYVYRADKYDNLTNCGEATPFFNGQSCIDCSGKTPIFNISSSTCVACPANFQYDITTKACIASKTTTPTTYKPNVAVSSPRVALGDNQNLTDLDNYLNGNGTECPKETPFVQKGNCINCPADKPYFSLDIMDCKATPDKTTFDPSTHKFVAGPVAKPIATDVPLNTPKLKMNDNSTDADWNNYVNAQKGKPLCGGATPYWNGATCISCPQLFNVITLKCDTCPGVFNPTTHKCSSDKPIATDVPLNTPTLKMNANSTDADWNSYADAQKNKPLCGTDKPYWSGTACISCPQYYNIITKACDTCP